jgi:hypothetical protein
MRGFPFLNLFIALALSGAVLLPLVWRSTRAVASPGLTPNDAPAPSPDKVPSRVSLRFVHAPSKVRLTAGDTVLHEWTAPGGALQLEETAALPVTADRAEFGLQIEWPAGTTDPTNVIVRVEPEKFESWEKAFWSSDGTVDEIVDFACKP